jgi:hypothetical protein
LDINSGYLTPFITPQLLAFVVNPNILEDGCPALLALSFFSDLIKLSCVDFTREEKGKKYT